jgi:hypothetical protein
MGKTYNQDDRGSGRLFHVDYNLVVAKHSVEIFSYEINKPMLPKISGDAGQ